MVSWQRWELLLAAVCIVNTLCSSVSEDQVSELDTDAEKVVARTWHIERMKIEVLKEPRLCKAKAAEGDTLTVTYQGTFEDGAIFDSSKNMRNGFSFILGKGQVIHGWDLALVGMCIGETYLLTCPPEFAYGVYGQPPTIPPLATLTFEIDLLRIKTGPTRWKKWGKSVGNVFPIVSIFVVCIFLFIRGVTTDVSKKNA